MNSITFNLTKDDVSRLKKMTAISDKIFVVVSGGNLTFAVSTTEQFRLIRKSAFDNQTLETVISSKAVKPILSEGAHEIQWDNTSVILAQFNQNVTTPKVRVVSKNKLVIGGDVRRLINEAYSVDDEDKSSALSKTPLSKLAMICKACDSGLVIENGTAHARSNTQYMFVKDCAPRDLSITVTKEGVQSLSDVQSSQFTSYAILGAHIVYSDLQTGYYVGVRCARQGVAIDTSFIESQLIKGFVKLPKYDLLNAIDCIPVTAIKSEPKFIVSVKNSSLIVGDKDSDLIAITTVFDRVIPIDRFVINAIGLGKVRTLLNASKSEYIDIIVYENFILIVDDLLNIVVGRRGD